MTGTGSRHSSISSGSFSFASRTSRTNSLASAVSTPPVPPQAAASFTNGSSDAAKRRSPIVERIRRSLRMSVRTEPEQPVKRADVQPPRHAFLRPSHGRRVRSRSLPDLEADVPGGTGLPSSIKVVRESNASAEWSDAAAAAGPGEQQRAELARLRAHVQLLEGALSAADADVHDLSAALGRAQAEASEARRLASVPSVAHGRPPVAPSPLGRSRLGTLPGTSGLSPAHQPSRGSPLGRANPSAAPLPPDDAAGSPLVGRRAKAGRSSPMSSGNYAPLASYAPLVEEGSAAGGSSGAESGSDGDGSTPASPPLPPPRRLPQMHKSAYTSPQMGTPRLGGVSAAGLSSSLPQHGGGLAGAAEPPGALPRRGSLPSEHAAGTRPRDASANAAIDGAQLRKLRALAVSVESGAAQSEPASPRRGQRQRRQRRELAAVVRKSPPGKARGANAAAAAPAAAAPAAAAPAVPPTHIDTAAPEAAVAVSELRVLRVLGAGGVGVVSLARHERSRLLYAIKAVGKPTVANVGDGAAVLRLRRERDALLALRGHPCVVQLHGTHADARRVYLVTEACMGGDLFRLLERYAPLGDEHAAFYAGAVLLALGAAHARAIAYRDLKPENVLIDAAGWPRLADWGAAVCVGPRAPAPAAAPAGAAAAPAGAGAEGRTHTRFGTLEYMSPEVCRGDERGHGLATDWWSFGALLFELLVGRTPCAAAASEDEKAILGRIARGQVVWPRPNEARLSAEASSLLRGLLRRDESARLGASTAEGGGYAAVRAHAFFRCVHLDGIANRAGVVPPWIPELERDDDTFAFDGSADARGAGGSAAVSAAMGIGGAAQGAAQMAAAPDLEPYDAARWDAHFADF